MMVEKDINKRLEDLEQRQTTIHDQLHSTKEILEAIENQMNEFQARRKERLQTDDRVSDDVTKALTEETEKTEQQRLAHE